MSLQFHKSFHNSSKPNNFIPEDTCQIFKLGNKEVVVQLEATATTKVTDAFQHIKDVHVNYLPKSKKRK